MTIINALVIFLAAVGLFFAVSIVYGLLSTRKEKPAKDTVTVHVRKGYLTSVLFHGEERPYVFSSPKQIYSESNSAIFMVVSAVLDGKEFPNLKVGETRITFIQAVNNSNLPFTPARLSNLVIEKNGEAMDIPSGILPSELPKEIIMTVRDSMNWGPMDFAYQHRTSSMSSFIVSASDFGTFVEDITTVSLGYRKETQDILLSESSFVSLDKGTFADSIKSCVLEWTKAIKDKMDSIQPSSNMVQN